MELVVHSFFEEEFNLLRPCREILLVRSNIEHFDDGEGERARCTRAAAVIAFMSQSLMEKMRNILHMNIDSFLVTMLLD